jgi:hypothetical protein
MYKTPTVCRACQSTDLVEVFNFGKAMPLANDWAQPDGARKGFVPLRVMFCPACTLAQLGETVDPAILYSNYLYVTSKSETMMRHFDRLTKDMTSENGAGSLLEVGANDGRFLNYAASRNFKPCHGIDPASNLKGTIELGNNVEMFNQFFGNPVIVLDKYDTILARHCFCHQEWTPFLAACERSSHKNTLVCIEVPYAPDLLARTEFDSIYHEHTSYLTIKAVAAALKVFPFHLHGVLKYGIHGGAVLVMLRHNDSGVTPHLSADEMLAEENINEGDWKRFSEKSAEKIFYLQDKVKLLKSGGHIVSVFGASAKSSVMINACGFSSKEISFVTDNSPLKPGRLVPGTDIPVIEEGEMLSQHPDYAICGAWNYRTEVLAKMDKWRSRGGKFIFPTRDGWEVV